MIDNNIDIVFERIKELNSNSSDIVTRIINNGNNRVGYIFLDSVSSDDKISDFLNKSLVGLDCDFSSFYKLVENSIFNSNIYLYHNINILDVPHYQQR